MKGANSASSPIKITIDKPIVSCLFFIMALVVSYCGVRIGVHNVGKEIDKYKD